MNDDDLTIYKAHADDTECDESDYTKCIAMRRLLKSMHYRSLYKIMGNEDDAHIFSNFMNVVYGNFIDDYHHFQDCHCDELEQIHKDLKENKLFIECTVKDCTYTSRHHETETHENEKENSITLDPHSMFYVSMMDSLHFQLYHSFETGMRTFKSNDDDDKEQYDEEKTNECFDAIFARLNQQIMDRHHLTASFQRFSTKNAKYTISMNGNTDNKENKENDTYYDGVIKHLLIVDGDIDGIKAIIEFLNKEEYDSDTMKYDEGLTEHGNIVKSIENTPCLIACVSIIKTTKLSETSFAVGFRTYYWQYYKDRKQLSEHEQNAYGFLNINTHSGYEVKELYVDAKYGSFEEEIGNYKYIDFIKQYKQKVLVKVKQFMETTKVKKTTATYDGATQYLKYGINKGDPIRLEHLLSLVFYTDFTNHSAHFSATFRVKNVFETLKNVIKRNSEYYFMAKYLRECVEIYGQCRDGDERYGRKILLCGPFYTGMNVVMSMPSFSIRLCSPTSTSKQIEVAMKFSGTGGIVLQLNNTGSHVYKYLHGFDTSWISQFPEEDERLFFGGFFPTVIESVRIRSTKQNFETFIGSLYYLDALLNGGEVADITINETDVFIIKNLFGNILKKNENKESKKRMDDYIYNTFAAFALNKTNIVLDLHQLNYANKEMRELLVHNLDRKDAGKEKEREDTDCRNLFKAEILDIFKNIQSMVIQSTCSMGYSSYSLSMIGLSKLIERGSVQEVIIKAVSHYGGDNWINTVWSASAQLLMKTYEMKNYCISMKQEKVGVFDGYVFVINKKS